jgi:O-antigen ligase
MLKIKHQNDLYFFIGFSAIVFSISPWWTTDGFNVPKFIVLIIFACTLILQFNFVDLINKFNSNKSLILTLLFPLNLILVVIINEANKIQQIFGDFGKRTGLLTYLACFVLFLYCAQLRDKDSRKLLAITMVFLGVISALYSLLQPFGIFQIDELGSKNMTPYSFFGNTNFSSAFAGFTTIFLIPLYKKSTPKSISRNFQLVLIFLLLIFSIYKTNSQQGLIISFSGYAIFFLIRILKKSTSIIIKSSFILIGIFLFIVFVQSLFGKGIATRIIFQESVLARNFYWRAGWDMAIANPFVGLGLDRYGDWFWVYRDLEAINTFGPNNNSRSAHNIYLDLASSGGLILLASYLLFLGFILLTATRTIFRNKDFDSTYITIFAAWIAFGVFSFISIGQIGVLVLNWILAGFLIASSTKQIYRDGDRHEYFKFKLSRLLIGILVGILMILPIARESVSSKNAIYENSPQALTNYLDNNKIEPRNISIIAQRLDNLGGNSLQYLRQAVIEFPNDYNLWYLILISKNSSSQEKQFAYDNILRLNPYNRLQNSQ